MTKKTLLGGHQISSTGVTRRYNFTDTLQQACTNFLDLTIIYTYNYICKNAQHLI